MSQPFIGEIRMGGWNFAPQNWAQCNGASVQISQNETLYSLLGTTYGGDGINTFNLPDMRSRIPMHQGLGATLGQASGNESVTLGAAQIPAHTHPIVGADVAGASADPAGLAPATAPAGALTYNPANNAVPMANLVGVYGQSQPHENRMPFLCVTFAIALFGVYPSRN